MAVPRRRTQSGPAQDGRESRYTTIKVRLYPTPEQTELLEKTFGCCRWLWNKMLADVQEFYAATDVHYIPTPAKYKKEAPFLTEVDSQPLCNVHQNLRRAFMDFFRDPASYGYPQLKTKKSGHDSFMVYCRQYRTGPSIYLRDGGIQMPKLGLVSALIHQKPLHWWPLRYVNISKSASGKYFCAITFECTAKAPEKVVPTKEKTLGINYSLRRFYVDSEGESPELPNISESKQKLARMQQKLARMERGSKNYAEQLQKIRLENEHIANQRKDFIHKQSRRIANAWDAVCVRDMDLLELSGKLGQGGVMDYGFGAFRQYLKYKLERQGKSYIVLDRLAPAAKTCNGCGNVNDSLDSHSKEWTCPSCGASIAREVNTARNIRDMGLEQYFNTAKTIPGANPGLTADLKRV